MPHSFLVGSQWEKSHQVTCRATKNTGVGSLSLLQGIFPTQESNQGLLHCRQTLYQLSYQGSPHLTAKWNLSFSLGTCHMLGEDALGLGQNAPVMSTHTGVRPVLLLGRKWATSEFVWGSCSGWRIWRQLKWASMVYSLRKGLSVNLALCWRKVMVGLLRTSKTAVLTGRSGDILGAPAVNTLSFHSKWCRFDPWLGN